MTRMRHMQLLGVLSIGAMALTVLPHFAYGAPQGDSVTVTINAVSAQGIGASMGTITFRDAAKGLEVTPKLSGLTPGDHGLHIHENPDCAPKEKDGAMVAALAAGPHFDPLATGKHMGPHGGGHKGDLPKLVVAQDGSTAGFLTLEGLKVSDIKNRSVMVHAGGDNYSDQPAPLGGGGARIACGVIR